MSHFPVWSASMDDRTNFFIPGEPSYPVWNFHGENTLYSNCVPFLPTVSELWG